MSPDEYCRENAAPTGATTHYSCMFLPEAKRRAAVALFAFDNELDQAIEASDDPHLPGIKLSWWRNEAGQMFAGMPQHPVTRALQPMLGRFKITENELNAVFDGREIDLERARHADFASLEKYCHAVADPLAAIFARICGYRDPATLEFARQTGAAIRLVTIIANVGKDARKNRIYLPVDELRRFDVPAADIINSRYIENFKSGENFKSLMSYQADRAERILQAAFSTLPDADRRTQRPVIVMAEIYRSLLHELRHEDFPVLTRLTDLTPLRKLWIAWKIWATT